MKFIEFFFVLIPRFLSINSKWACKGSACVFFWNFVNFIYIRLYIELSLVSKNRKLATKLVLWFIFTQDTHFIWRSYNDILKNGKFWIKIDEETSSSSWRQCRAGVLQGSLLCLVFFNIHTECTTTRLYGSIITWFHN